MWDCILVNIDWVISGSIRHWISQDGVQSRSRDHTCSKELQDNAGRCDGSVISVIQMVLWIICSFFGHSPQISQWIWSHANSRKGRTWELTSLINICGISAKMSCMCVFVLRVRSSTFERHWNKQIFIRFSMETPTAAWGFSAHLMVFAKLGKTSTDTLACTHTYYQSKSWIPPGLL